MIQSQQAGGGIGAAAADAAANRQVLVQPDVGSQPAVAVLLQQAGGPHNQIVGAGYSGQLAVQQQLAVITHTKMQLVGQIKKLEQGLQFVVAVSAAANH